MDGEQRHAVAARVDLVAEQLERDVGRDLLRVGHLLLAEAVLERRAHALRCLDDRRAARPDPGQQPLQQPRRALSHVDEVDRSLVGSRVLGLEVDERRHRVGGIDQLDLIAVGRRDPEHEERHDDHERARRGEPAG